MNIFFSSCSKIARNRADKSKKVENKGFRENFDYKYEATRPPSQSQLKPALRYYSITFFEIAVQDNYVTAEKMRNTYFI